jgi:hypothetical protein|tara:strand:- start:878 stop:1057 length:180 start_codon:yes stop_codon:yes gene_type:complete
MSVEDQRKAQEEIVNMLKGGYYKDFIKVQSEFFKGYIAEGFTREESLQLVIALTKSRGS